MQSRQRISIAECHTGQLLATKRNLRCRYAKFHPNFTQIGFLLPVIADYTYNQFTEVSRQYSSLLAKRYPELSRELVTRVMKYAESSSPSFSSNFHSQNVVHMILPWLANFSKVENSWEILDSLYSFTVRYFGNHIVEAHVKVLWNSLASPDELSNEVTMDCLVDFLMAKLVPEQTEKRLTNVDDFYDSQETSTQQKMCQQIVLCIQMTVLFENLNFLNRYRYLQKQSLGQNASC